MSGSAQIASALNADHFMTLFLEQIKHQDPMEPMTNVEMVNQMAAIASLETSRDLQASFSELLKLQQLQNGSSLLGRTVQYAGTDGPAQGVVSQIKTSGENIALVIDEAEEIGLSDITTVF